MTVANMLETQAGYCESLGSPLYASVLRAAAADETRGGPTRAVLEGAPAGTNHTALRLMAAVHGLALQGRLTKVAAHFPSCGGDGDPDAAWRAIRETFAQDRALVRSAFDATRVQTNEPGRSAALVGAFAYVARRTGLPLRLLEIGASAGLNLRFDRFRFGNRWGPADSPVALDLGTTGPPLDGSIDVAERLGCDPRPIDAATDDGALLLRSLVWADQIRRLALLEGAIAIARATPVRLDTESAGTWLPRMLAATRPGVATVVFHSIVMEYVSDDERATVDAAIAAAGARASAEAPLARVSMEPDGEMAAVVARLWPDGEERLLARAGYHGTPVIWLG